MLEELFQMHRIVMQAAPTRFSRYLYSCINWKAHGLCVVGDRGVGKTTLLCQDLLERYGSPEQALYISADYVNVLAYGLLPIAKEFFDYGGKALYIDEVHKYPDWSLAIKNLLDVYKKKQIIFSASSSVDLNQSKGDLSRRVVYHRLLGLSFREYMKLAHGIDLPQLSFDDILRRHVKIASDLEQIPILKHFKDYLEHGYYPYFLEGLDDYPLKLHNLFEMVLFEDLAVVYNLKQTTLPILKRILWLVATSAGLVPNIDKMSKNLGISREMIYNCLAYLASSGLVNEVFASAKGHSLVRKPGKIYLNNSNLLTVINGLLKVKNDIGTVRETFFVNQVGSKVQVLVHDKGDFLVDGQYSVEVGGKGKDHSQVRGEKQAFLALDGITVGFGNKIPLYLFGLLY